MNINEGIAIRGDWDFIYEEGTRESYKNPITQSGLNFLGMLFVNEYTNDIPFYLAMGTGTTAAVNGDVKLQSESFRKIVTKKARQNTMLLAYVSSFNRMKQMQIGRNTGSM